MSQSQFQKHFLCRRGAIDDPDNPAFTHDGDAVGHPENFGEFGRDQNDGQPRLSEFAHHPVDFGLGSDVDSLGRFIEDQNARLTLEPFRQYDFLLIPTGQVIHGRGDRSGFDPEPGDRIPSADSLYPPIEESEV